MVQHEIVSAHEISRKVVEVDKAKIDVITKLPISKCVKDIRSFLGHVGFYRRFIKDFSKISRPLTNLLVNDVPFIFVMDVLSCEGSLKWTYLCINNFCPGLIQIN